MKLLVGSERRAPGALVGSGGEAEVFELDAHRVVKLFKTPDHPDIQGDPAAEAAARARLDEHQRKLPAFPPGLPDRIVAPLALVRRRARGPLIGYAMRRVTGEPLYRYAEPSLRRAGTVTGNAGLAALRDLRATVARLHQRGVVVGDLSDLNALVAGGRVYLIDADSFQLPGFPCTVYNERFVDPLLCDPAAPTPVLVTRPSPASDWYAFAVLAMRTLLCIGPYGGVHRPRDLAARVSPSARPLRRITIFRDDVLYPKAALHWSVLPDELLAYFSQVFQRDLRAPLPAELLDTLRWTMCARCGAEHARPVCPGCRPRIQPREPTLVRGDLSVDEVRVDEVPQPAPWCWLEGGQLWADGRFGPSAFARVVSGRTWLWCGAEQAFALAAVGRMALGWVARRGRPGATELLLPRLEGDLIEARAIVGDAHVWLHLVEKRGPRVVERVLLLSARGEPLASAEGDAWMSGLSGACAVGDRLLVPSDAGILRIDAAGDRLAPGRVFPTTEPFVDTACRLVAGPAGLYVLGPGRALRLRLS